MVMNVRSIAFLGKYYNRRVLENDNHSFNFKDNDMMTISHSIFLFTIYSVQTPNSAFATLD